MQMLVDLSHFIFRFCTLQEALITIPAVEEAKNGKKRHAKEHYDEDLWCTHCMDDSNIEICGFCGCKVRDLDFLFIVFGY